MMNDDHSAAPHWGSSPACKYFAGLARHQCTMAAIASNRRVDPQRMAPLRRSSLHFRYERERVHWDLLVALALMITTAVYLL